MFAFAYVVHLFSHEFARLSAWSLSFAFVLACSFDCFLFWHMILPVLKRTIRSGRSVAIPPATYLRQQRRRVRRSRAISESR